jgi:hypothetical protein
MDFLKALFEGNETGTLTYEQFASAAKASGIKLADLSKGEYVAKKKYEDDLNGKETLIADLNATIDTRNTDLKALQEKLDKAGTDSTQIENLSGELEKLRKDYDKATKEYNSKLQKQAYEFAVKEFAGEQSFSSNAARRDFINSMLAKNLPMENGNIMGAKDYMAEYAKDNSDAFVVKEEPKPNDNLPKFASNTTDPNNAGANGHKQSLSELMKAKNDNPSMIINFG